MAKRKTKVSPHWTRRIRQWLDRGAAEDRAWYRDAHRWCKDTAERHGTDTRRVAAVLASLSPGTNWNRNLKETAALIGGYDLEFTTYPANVKKARGILDAEARKDYIDLVKPRPDSGQKIGAFYRNIAEPEIDCDVTIDRHAIAICIGHAPSGKEQGITDYKYRCFAEAYRIVARERNMLAHEVQAITWAAYRRKNGDLHQVDLPF